MKSMRVMVLQNLRWHKSSHYISQRIHSTRIVEAFLKKYRKLITKNL